MKFGTDIDVLMINTINSCEPLTFHVVSSSGQNIKMSSILIYNQMPAKLMTFPSSSAVL